MNLFIFNFKREIFSREAVSLITRKLTRFAPLMGILFLILLFPLVVLVLSGETVPVKTVIHRQQNSPREVFWGRAYTGVDRYYKILSLKIREPGIIVLGSSRVNQIRANFFKDSREFYNAAQTIERTEDLRAVLRRIPRRKEPRLLLLGLDHWTFNDHWAGYKIHKISKREQGEPFWPFVLLSKWREIYQDFFADKFSLNALLSAEKRRDAIGLSAFMSHRGYRNDGSYCYSDVGSDYEVSSPTHIEFKHEMGRIADGGNRFEYGEAVSARAVREVDQFLKECRARNIHVIGFLPPFAHVVYERLQEYGEKYDYMWKLEQSLKPLFEAYGFEFYDFSDLAGLGASDYETFDGFHITEKAYLRLCLAIAGESQRLASYIDVLLQKKRLDATRGDLTVFLFEETPEEVKK